MKQLRIIIIMVCMSNAVWCGGGDEHSARVYEARCAHVEKQLISQCASLGYSLTDDRDKSCLVNIVIANDIKTMQEYTAAIKAYFSKKL